jgi:hypothetical protein
MSENWNEIGKKLFDATNAFKIDAVKKIVTKFQRNAQVLDWKNEKVDCKFALLYTNLISIMIYISIHLL